MLSKMIQQPDLDALILLLEKTSQYYSKFLHSSSLALVSCRLNLNYLHLCPPLKQTCHSVQWQHAHTGISEWDDFISSANRLQQQQDGQVIFFY